MTNNLNQFSTAYNDTFLYSYDNNIIIPKCAERIISLTHKDAKVLELGIGHGFSTDMYLEYFSDFTVLDGSPSVIENYLKTHPNSKAKIIQTYFEEFETNEQFDVIIMGFILEHVDDPEFILKKYKRLLKKNGTLYASVPNAESLHRRIGYEAGLLDDLFRLGKGDHELGHQRTYSVKTLSQQLTECGYKVLKKEGLFLKLLTTQQLISLNLSSEIIKALSKISVTYPELSAALLFEAQDL